MRFDPAWRIVAWCDGMEFVHLLGCGAGELVIICPDSNAANWVNAVIAAFTLAVGPREFAEAVSGHAIETDNGCRFTERLAPADDSDEWPLGADSDTCKAWAETCGKLELLPDGTLRLPDIAVVIQAGTVAFTYYDGIIDSGEKNRTACLYLGLGAGILASNTAFENAQAARSRMHIEIIIRDAPARAAATSAIAAQEFTPVIVPHAWSPDLERKVFKTISDNAKCALRFISARRDCIITPHDPHVGCVARVRTFTRGRNITEMRSWASYEFGKEELGALSHKAMNCVDDIRQDGDVLVLHLCWRPDDIGFEDSATLALDVALAHYERIIIVDVSTRSSSWFHLFEHSGALQHATLTHASSDGRNSIMCLDQSRVDTYPYATPDANSDSAEWPRIVIYVREPCKAGTLAFYRLVSCAAAAYGVRCEVLLERNDIAFNEISAQLVCIHDMTMDPAASFINPAAGIILGAVPLPPPRIVMPVGSARACASSIVDYVAGMAVHTRPVCNDDKTPLPLAFHARNHVDGMLANTFMTRVEFDLNGVATSIESPIDHGDHWPGDSAAVIADRVASVLAARVRVALISL